MMGMPRLQGFSLGRARISCRTFSAWRIAACIIAWKKQLLAGAEAIFAHGTKATSADVVAREAELYEQIARLEIELDATPLPRI